MSVIACKARRSLLAASTAAWVAYACCRSVMSRMLTINSNSALLVERAQARLERKLASIAPSSRHREGSSHGTHLGCGRIVLAVQPMELVQALGKEQLDGLAQQLVGGVSEEFLSLVVDQPDTATRIRHHRGVRGELHQRLNEMWSTLPAPCPASVETVRRDGRGRQITACMGVILL